MKNDLFEGIAVDEAKRDNIRRMPAAEKTVVILFTPRSGSSWLTDIIAQSGQLGRANELFNPNFLPSTARALSSSHLDDYICAAKRRFNLGNTFSFEITMHQMNAVFESPDDFYERFGDAHFIWLTRRDIVAQAVSLAKMVSKRIAHSPHVSKADIEKADQTFTYSDAEIRKWISHIYKAEIQTEAFLSVHNLRPRRLMHEDMMAKGARETLRELAGSVGTNLIDNFSLDEKHSKVGTKRNEEFIARFKSQNRLFLGRLGWQRRKLFRQK